MSWEKARTRSRSVKMPSSLVFSITSTAPTPCIPMTVTAAATEVAGSTVTSRSVITSRMAVIYAWCHYASSTAGSIRQLRGRRRGLSREPADGREQNPDKGERHADGTHGEGLPEADGRTEE